MGVSQAMTRPVWIASLDFTPAIRISSRGYVLFAGNQYTGVGDLKINQTLDGMEATLEWFDQQQAVGDTLGIPTDPTWAPLIYNQWQGSRRITCTLRFYYGETEDSFTSDWDESFSGYVSSVRLRKYSIQMDLAQQLKYSPRQIIGPPVCNHIPPDGTTLSHGNGAVLILRREGNG